MGGPTRQRSVSFQTEGVLLVKTRKKESLEKNSSFGKKSYISRFLSKSFNRSQSINLSIRKRFLAEWMRDAELSTEAFGIETCCII